MISALHVTLVNLHNLPVLWDALHCWVSIGTTSTHSTLKACAHWFLTEKLSSCVLFLSWQWVFLIVAYERSSIIVHLVSWCECEQLETCFQTRKLFCSSHFTHLNSPTSTCSTVISMYLSAAVWCLIFKINYITNDLLLPLHDDYKYDKPCKLFEGICL